MDAATFQDRTHSRDLVDVRREIVTLPTAPVARAGGVVAGVFTVLATLVLLGEIGMATGLSAYDAGDRAAPYVLGAGIYGVVSAIIAFLVGGYVAARLGRPAPGRSGAMHGGLVWAVCVPVIGFVAAFFTIATVTAAGVSTIAAVQADPAAAAEAAAAVRARTGDPVVPAGTIRASFDPRLPASAKMASAARAAGAVGWGAVAALFLCLGAAAFGGVLGSNRYKTVIETSSTEVPPRSFRDGAVVGVGAGSYGRAIASSTTDEAGNPRR